LLYFDYPLSRVRKRTRYATIAPLGEKRAASLTLTEIGSTAAASAAVITSKEDVLLLKRGSPKVVIPSPFFGDKSKFNAYVL
jgi:hypothetical protein